MQKELDKLKEKFQEQQKANAEALAEERQARKKAEAEAAVTNEKKKQQEAEAATQAAQKGTNKLIQDSISLLNKQTVYFKKNPVVYNSNILDANRWKYQLNNIINGKITNPDEAADIISKYRQWFDGMKTSAVEAGITGATAIDKIKHAITKFGSWNIMTFAITKLKRGLVDIVKNVKELDAAMTELQKVTDETSTRYERFVKDAAASAKQLGTTLVGIVNATSTFARLGYNIDDASEYAKIATVYKNVGDSIESIDDAASSLVSTMKAFKLESISDAWGIIDLFNEVGNSFATTSGDIGEAMKRSASALYEAGNTIEQSVGLYTAAQTIVQDADIVGTALKTLSMRLRGTKTDLEAAGLDVDGLASSTSSLRGEILALANVDIMKSATEFKSTYEMLQDLSKVWDKLEETSRARVLELVAGKRMASTVAAIINNFDIAEEVAGLNYSGSALKENEKYLESINGRIDVLKASYEELSQTVLDSGLVKAFVDIGNAVVNAFNWLFSAEISSDSPIGKLGNISKSVYEIKDSITSLIPSLDHVSKIKLWGILPTIIPAITAISNVLSKGNDNGYVQVKREGTSLRLAGTDRWANEKEALSEKDYLDFLGLGDYTKAEKYLKKNKDKFDGLFKDILTWKDKIDEDGNKVVDEKTGEVVKEFSPLFKTDPQKYQEKIKQFGAYADAADQIAHSTEQAAEATDMMGEAVVRDTFKYKAFTVAAKAANVALSTLKSLAISFAIQLAINAVVAFVDELKNGMSNAVERVSDAKSALESVDEKISDTTKELEETQSRIKDIQGLGKLSITDASDLRNLQLSNAQLLVQLSLLEKEKELKEAELNAGKNAVWNRFQNSRRDGYYTSQGGQEKLTQEEYVNYMRDQLPKQYERIAALNQLASQRDLTAAEKGELNLLQSGIEKAQTNLLEIAENLKDIDSESSNAVIAMIAWLTSDGKTQLELFNTYAGSVSEGVQKSLLDMASAGTLTEESLKRVVPEQTLEAMVALCGSIENVIYQYETMANSGADVTGSLYAQARELEFINEDIDSLQSSYKTLVAAISEYNANGYMTVDTLQSFLSLSDDYIDQLSLENGQLVLNRDAIISLTNARLDEMLARKWDDTVSRIDTIIKEKDATEETTEAIDSKTIAVSEMTDELLRNYVVTQLGLKSEEEINAEIRAAINSFNVYKAVIDSARRGTDRYTDATLGAAGATKSLVDAVDEKYKAIIDKEKARINAAKEVLEDRKKDLQDELNALEDTYEAEDKLLELEKAKDRYEAAKANKNVRLYTADKGWQWVSDPQELEDAKNNLDELHKEMERDEAKKAIQDQIDAIDDLIEKCDEALDILGQDWDDYVEHLNLIAEMQGLTMQELGDQVEGFAKRAISWIRQYAAELAAAQAQAAAGLPTPGGNYPSDTTTSNNPSTGSDDYAKRRNEAARKQDEARKEQERKQERKQKALDKNDADYASHKIDSRTYYTTKGNILKGYYATGAKYVPSSGVYNVDDGIGRELIVRRGRFAGLEVGDGVVPADLTARLFSLARSPEQYIMPKVNSLLATLSANLIEKQPQAQQLSQQPIYINEVHVSGVNNMDEFLDELTKTVNRKRKV